MQRVEDDDRYRFIASQLRVVAEELLRKTMIHVCRKQEQSEIAFPPDVNALWQSTLKRVREFDMTSEANYLCCLVLSVPPTKANLKSLGLDASKTCEIMDAVARRFVTAFYPGKRPRSPIQREDLLRFMTLFVQSLCDWPTFRHVECARPSTPIGETSQCLDEAYRAVVHTTWSRWAVLAELEEDVVEVAKGAAGSPVSGGSRVSRPPASFRSAPVSTTMQKPVAPPTSISISQSLPSKSSGSFRLPPGSPSSSGDMSVSPLPPSFGELPGSPSGGEKSVQLSSRPPDGGDEASSSSYRDPFGGDFDVDVASLGAEGSRET